MPSYEASRLNQHYMFDGMPLESQNGIRAQMSLETQILGSSAPMTSVFSARVGTGEMHDMQTSVMLKTLKLGVENNISVTDRLNRTVRENSLFTRNLQPTTIPGQHAAVFMKKRNHSLQGPETIGITVRRLIGINKPELKEVDKPDMSKGHRELSTRIDDSQI